jgi:hypothetical protein
MSLAAGDEQRWLHDADEVFGPHNPTGAFSDRSS